MPLLAVQGLGPVTQTQGPEVTVSGWQKLSNSSEDSSQSPECPVAVAPNCSGHSSSGPVSGGELAQGGSAV